MEKKKLKFGDIDSQSDLEKKIDGEIKEEENLTKEADLYHHILYTAVPKDCDTSLGIYPTDQQLTNSMVLLWNSLKGIPTSVTDNDYKVLKIVLKDSTIRNMLKSLGGGVYGVRGIPNTVTFEEVDPIAFKEED